MSESAALRRPWLVAVWPGMGHVASAAGQYLRAKLDMEPLTDIQAPEAFDVERVEVEDGLIQAGRPPRNRLFVWRDPAQQRDLVLFIGDAQPDSGKQAFCRKLIDYAERLGVERVFTFAAMATDMHPDGDVRLYGAATDLRTLGELRRLGVEVINDGHIGGLNGILLGVAAERGLRGACLLGEIPQLFAQVPFPQASVAVLGAFTTLAGLALDLDELAVQAAEIRQGLSRLLENMQEQFRGKLPGPGSAPTPDDGFTADLFEPEESVREGLAPVDEARIERLFREAAADRSRAVELKHLLDRLGAYPTYEDRFLDLFRQAG